MGVCGNPWKWLQLRACKIWWKSVRKTPISWPKYFSIFCLYIFRTSRKYFGIYRNNKYTTLIYRFCFLEVSEYSICFDMFGVFCTINCYLNIGFGFCVFDCIWQHVSKEKIDIFSKNPKLSQRCQQFSHGPICSIFVWICRTKLIWWAQTVARQKKGTGCG